MRFYFPLLFIIVLKLSAASGLFSYKLWNKQRLISEVVKNYLLSCQRLDILKNVENLKKVFQLGIVQNVNFWEQLEILVDLPKFCDQKELMSAKSGHLDCFEMPKNGNLLRLLNEYKIQVDKNEKFIRRLLVCKLIFRMDRPKVSEKNVKALIADFLIEERNRPIYFESKINKSVNSTSKENMEDVDSEHNKRLVLIDYEASEWQLRLENLLNNLYHLYKKSEIITGLQTNIKTKINIKKNDVGTNVRMQTSIHSERHLNDACKILKNNTEIFDLVEAHLVNKADRSNIETIFNNIKGIEIKIHRKILKRNKNSRYGSSSSENNTSKRNPVHCQKIFRISVDNSKCISDLVTLTAIIELYQSLIDAIAQRIQTLEDNSYKIFCPEKNSNCSKDDLMRVLFKMRKKAELLNASINSWFKRKLVKNEYEELQYQLRSKVDGHFPILIIDNEMPKHRGIVARMEDGLRKIRNQIYQPTWEASKNKKKMGKQGRNRYRYFNSTPRIKKIYKHKPRILYVVDEPSRPAYYYQKRLKRGFWNN